MRVIKKYADQIKDELCSAKEYAEKYLYNKAKGNSKWAKYYFDMAQDEIKHANHIHEIAMDEIESLQQYYTPTEEMREAWEKSHAEYVEKTAWIKKMLEM